MLEINDQTQQLMNNANVKSILERSSINTGLGKENTYSYSFFTLNQTMNFAGCCFLGEQKEFSKTGKKVYKSLLLKGAKLKDGTEIPRVDFSIDDLLKQNKENGIDYSKFQAVLGIDAETGIPNKVNLFNQLHTMVLGGTGSGKSVFIFSALIQMMKNPLTEFYIIDKGDFKPIANCKKCIYRGDFANITGEDFLAFKNYLVLEYTRRKAEFEKVGLENWDSYEKLRKSKPELNLKPINYIYVLIDEFQTLRTRVSRFVGEVSFDNSMKELLDVVRAYGMCFYFGTQDYLKSRIGETRTAVQQFYFGKMDNVAGVGKIEMGIMQKGIVGTKHFYDEANRKILKIPYDPNTAHKIVEEGNKPENRLKENTCYKDNLVNMLNDALDRLDSEIFAQIKRIFRELKIKSDYLEKLKSSSLYIPFCIFVFTLYRAIRINIITDKDTDIFLPISNWKYAIDEILWKENIEIYKNNKKFMSQIEGRYDLAQDQEEFIDAISDVLNNYLKGMLGETSFFGDEESEEEKKEGGSASIESSGNEDDDEGYTDDDEGDEEEHVLISMGYTGNISPTSFNSMYYPGKDGEFHKSSEASKYEKQIRSNLINRMVAKEKKQIRVPVILDLEFFLGIPVKKNGELSKIGRNDLDNLLKATIDGINQGCLKDDTQVFCIRAKMNYIEKHSSHSKNNKVQIKVIELNKDTYSKYVNMFEDQGYVALTPKMYIPITGKVKVPSVNNMYFINTQGKQQLQSNVLEYKNVLSKQIEHRYGEIVSPYEKELALFLNFSVANVNERDLDNMLKATIDAFTGQLYKDDSLVKEIICTKTKLQNSLDYNGKVYVQTFKYDLARDILGDDKEIEAEDIFIPVDDEDDEALSFEERNEGDRNKEILRGEDETEISSIVGEKEKRESEDYSTDFNKEDTDNKEDEESGENKNSYDTDFLNSLKGNEVKRGVEERENNEEKEKNDNYDKEDFDFQLSDSKLNSENFNDKEVKEEIVDMESEEEDDNFFLEEKEEEEEPFLGFEEDEEEPLEIQASDDEYVSLSDIYSKK